MNPPSEDIMDFLEADADLNLTSASNLFVGSEPTEPDNTVTIYDTPDRGPLLFLDPEDPDGDGKVGENRYEYVAVQVRVRNNSYLAGMRVAGSIMGTLHNRKPVINGTQYTLIAALDNPALLEYDKKGRAIVITNYELQRTPQ